MRDGRTDAKGDRGGGATPGDGLFGKSVAVVESPEFGEGGEGRG
jgi:hypothetical protein